MFGLDVLIILVYVHASLVPVYVTGRCGLTYIISTFNWYPACR